MVAEGIIILITDDGTCGLTQGYREGTDGFADVDGGRKEKGMLHN
jgi:hypothetical protein